MIESDPRKYRLPSDFIPIFGVINYNRRNKVKELLSLPLGEYLVKEDSMVTNKSTILTLYGISAAVFLVSFSVLGALKGLELILNE